MYVIDPDNLAEGYAKRVFFGGQRHNALPDLLTAAESQGKDPNMFLEWLPRQTKEEKDLSTCRYEGSIGQWMHKGYAGRKFCEGVCREDYIKICPYHQQKARPEPIVFGQHAHLVLGHPLMDQCSVFIGDENPMSIFPQTWAIPQRFIYTQAMDWEEPLVEMLFSIQGLLDQPDLVLRGPELLAALGGPRKVYELCRDFVLPAESLLTPTVRRPEDVERIEYNFLPEFVPMLQREAEAALTGRPYIDRIKLGKGVLELSTRRKVDKSVPSHLIWFDATGEQKFYEAMFERPVEVVDAVPDFVGRVWQVHDKLNGKGALIKDGDAMADPEYAAMFEDGKVIEAEAQQQVEATKTVEQAKVIFESLARKHDRMAVISFKGLTGTLGSTYEFMHFYANRGSNQLEGTNALIVFGTPMPTLEAMIQAAKCIYFDRMTPFDVRWKSVVKPYRYQDNDGDWLGNVVREFEDPQLNVILWQSREAELIQAVHRARLVINDCDVYLFSSIPIAAIPPYRLVSTSELLGGDEPEGVSPLAWAKVKVAANNLADETGAVTASDLAERAGISIREAYRSINRLLDVGEWDMAIVRADGRGKGKKQLIKKV
jgi:hypothetical protein